MAGIEDLKKQMSQIADDEYYAGLQSLFERDPENPMPVAAGSLTTRKEKGKSPSGVETINKRV